ncbi:MAG: MTAP family purine nucleoside phosphorylase [Actinobacteria bacterium]|nr:MAG: MTAP family purine nucleoside phosphorylase [Actinomycetota bacterium]
MAEAEIGVIGMGGEANPLEGGAQIELDTPYGKTSAPITIGDLDGKSVAFLPRRGEHRELPPPQIPYRANVWAMKELGVRRIVGAGVCGALRMDYDLGDFVVFDQFVDRTWGRVDSFFRGPVTKLVTEAEPFCVDLRRILVETARELDLPVHFGGTVVVIQGPRFSTRAESELYRMVGWDVVDMITYPECHLARELELCYAHIGMVTDYDIGVQGAGAVTGASIARVSAQNADRLMRLLRAAVPSIGPQPQDDCATALALADI